MRIIHGSLHLRVSSCLKALALISNKGTGCLYSARLDGDPRSGELIPNINLREDLHITIPKLPMELLDAIIASISWIGMELMDGLYWK